MGLTSQSFATGGSMSAPLPQSDWRRRRIGVSRPLLRCWFISVVHCFICLSLHLITGYARNVVINQTLLKVQLHYFMSLSLHLIAGYSRNVIINYTLFKVHFALLDLLLTSLDNGLCSKRHDKLYSVILYLICLSLHLITCYARNVVINYTIIILCSKYNLHYFICLYLQQLLHNTYPTILFMQTKKGEFKIRSLPFPNPRPIIHIEPCCCNYI